MFKGDYHFNYLIGIPSEFDFYAGARAGFDAGATFRPDVGVQVGARWYWSPVWGLNLEISGGTAFGTYFGFSSRL